MATRNKQTKAADKNGDWKGFVNFSLGATDKATIKRRAEASDDLLPTLQELVEGGYVVRFSWDDYSDCPMVMLQGKECMGGNRGWAMSFRHTDLKTAVIGILYQHIDLSGDDNEWPKPSEIRSEYDW